LRAPVVLQLARADALLIVGDANAPPIAPHDLPIFHGKLEPDPESVASLKGQRVLAFAAFPTIIAIAPTRRQHSLRKRSAKSSYC
jgi:tetraacyldisaccharide 4'-kinase